MDNKVFREKNLERISSAEDLHQYMRVTSPRLWMFLSVILVLIIGFIVFACLVTIENNVDTKAVVERYDEKGAPSMTIDIEIPAEVGEVVHIGTEVRVENQKGTITSIYENDTLGKGAMVELEDPAFLFEEGTYKAKIVLETISPIRFLIR